MIWVLYMAVIWAVLFILAARDEIADAWRTHHIRRARKEITR
ncbi:hypothetical protein [Kitasatospora sp. McL0602]